MDNGAIDRYIKVYKSTSQLLELAQQSIADVSPNDKNNILTGVAAMVSAPTLYFFVKWLLDHATRNNIKRLYFLARDGEIFFNAAQIIVKAQNLDVDCRYLYCSRIAWRFPSYFILGKQASLDMICLKSYDITANKVLNRAMLDEPQKSEILARIGFDGDANVPLSEAELAQLKTKLADDVQFFELVADKSREAYLGAEGYFRQSGLFDDVKFAIVDSGWTGSMQLCLNRLLAHGGNNRAVSGYYFGLYDLPDERIGEYNCWYFDKVNTEGNLKRKVYFNNNLFECLCSNNEGMTQGYQMKDGVFEPVFKFAPANGFDSKTHSNVVLRFVELAAKAGITKAGTRQTSDCARQLVFQLLKRLMARPSRDEAEVLGKIRFSDDTDVAEERELARLLTHKELAKYNVLRRIICKLLRIRNPVSTSFWLEGSITRSTRRLLSLHFLNAMVYSYIKFR